MVRREVIWSGRNFGAFRPLNRGQTSSVAPMASVHSTTNASHQKLDLKVANHQWAKDPHIRGVVSLNVQIAEGITLAYVTAKRGLVLCAATLAICGGSALNKQLDPVRDPFNHHVPSLSILPLAGHPLHQQAKMGQVEGVVVKDKVVGTNLR